jgi:hypothetical protein
MVKLIHICILFGVLLSSCNLEKDIEIDLPPYSPQPVVECYIEPGKPYRLALFETVDYFNIPNNPIIPDALVIISYNGTNDTLKYQIIPDTLEGKLYNYVGDTTKKVPYDYSSPFSLYIKDNKGRILTSTTYIPQPVFIDSIWFVFNDEGRATSNIRFQDVNPSIEDFYRFVVVVNPFNFTEKGDIYFSDRLITSSTIQVTSRSTVEPGIIDMYLLHLTTEHYNYIKSADDADNANGNPFAQPSVIKSNINGGIGIFTGLNTDRRKVLVPTP